VKRYNRARDSLETLGASLGMMARFQKIHHADLKMSGDIVEENRLGQRSDTLPWFWRLDRNLEGQADDILDEFHRVNWIRAKAQYTRWKEELALVEMEMKWVISWFGF
ncbi:hypothetical protein JAAARDRAFT_126089, partial [Jaapia argillacea MUCL 33604]